MNRPYVSPFVGFDKHVLSIADGLTTSGEL